jgi:hypothetical protein
MIDARTQVRDGDSEATTELRLIPEVPDVHVPGDARCRQTSLSHLVGAPHIEQEGSRNAGQITSMGDHGLAVDVPGHLLGPNNPEVVADRLVEPETLVSS